MLSTMKSGFDRRRRTEFDDTGVKIPMKLDTTYDHDVQSHKTFESLQTPVRTVRGEGLAKLDLSRFAAKGPAAQTSRGLFGGKDQMNTTQVSYTFKQFKQDSQKDHTKHILPSVIKFK